VHLLCSLADQTQPVADPEKYIIKEQAEVLNPCQTRWIDSGCGGTSFRLTNHTHLAPSEAAFRRPGASL
jgi:hypothetical protein